MGYRTSLTTLAAAASLGLYACQTTSALRDVYEPIPNSSPPAIEEPIAEAPPPVLGREMEIGFPTTFTVKGDRIKGHGYLAIDICVDGKFVDEYKPCAGGRVVKASTPTEDLSVILEAYSLVRSEMSDGDMDKIGLLGKYDKIGVFRIKGMIVDHQEVMFPSFDEYEFNKMPDPHLPSGDFSL